MNSYQKLKARNAELEKDIYLMIRKPDTMEGISAFLKHKMRFDISDAIMFGEPTGEVRGISGLLNKLTDSPNEQ